MSMHHPTPEVVDPTTRQTEDPQARNVLLIGLIGAILLFAIVTATQGIYMAALENEKQVKLYGVQDQLYANELQAQKASLADYKYVDETNGVVQIPIDRAMDLFLKELDQPKAVPSEQ